MRFVYFLILLIILAVVGVFAWQNSESVSIHYFDHTLAVQTVILPMSLLIAGAYLLGMLSGWTVVGFLKRSIERVTERPTYRQ